jgi:hypothetical protein
MPEEGAQGAGAFRVALQVEDIDERCSGHRAAACSDAVWRMSEMVMT